MFDFEKSTDGIIKIHDLEIDPICRTVTRAGENISLTPREFDLLVLLAKHRGKVLTRSFIWHQYYNEFAARKSNVIDVRIRALRTKMDDGFDSQLIHTKHGQGYYLSTDESAQTRTQ